jgi:SAM-dependent methyltransferase
MADQRATNGKKLNLGSGKFKKEGFVNVDNVPGFNPDVLHDLEVFPYPFQDDTFELVEADHVLEHLERPLHVIRELHRVSKSGGVIHIRVPHFSRGFTHPEHKCAFDVSLPYYFDPKFSARYEDDIVMDLIKMRLHWAAQPHIKRLVLRTPMLQIYFGVGAVIDFFANLSPNICSRIWCYWVGGFDEIEYVFRVTK